MKRIYDMHALMQRTGLCTYEQLIQNDYDVQRYFEEIKIKLQNDISDLQSQLMDIDNQICCIDKIHKNALVNCETCNLINRQPNDDYVIDNKYDNDNDNDNEDENDNDNDDYDIYFLGKEHDDDNDDCSLSGEHFDGLYLDGMYIGT